VRLRGTPECDLLDGEEPVVGGDGERQGAGRNQAEAERYEAQCARAAPHLPHCTAN